MGFLLLVGLDVWSGDGEDALADRFPSQAVTHYKDRYATVKHVVETMLAVVVMSAQDNAELETAGCIARDMVLSSEHDRIEGRRRSVLAQAGKLDTSGLYYNLLIAVAGP